MVEAKPFREIYPKSDLQARAAQPGGITKDQAMSNAHTSLLMMREDYAKWLKKDLKELKIAFTLYTKTGDLKAISMKAHDIKGQAGTFGFPAISLVCGSLGRLIEESEIDIPPKTIELHMDALNLITLNGVREECSADAKVLIESLTMMVSKFLKKEI